jgi:hypothetical protein
MRLFKPGWNLGAVAQGRRLLPKPRRNIVNPVGNWTDWAGGIAAKYRMNRRMGRIPELIFQRLFRPLSLFQPGDIQQSFYTNLQIYFHVNGERERVRVQTTTQKAFMTPEAVKPFRYQRKMLNQALENKPVHRGGIAATSMQLPDIKKSGNPGFHLEVGQTQTILSKIAFFSDLTRNRQRSFSVNAKLKSDPLPTEGSSSREPRVKDLIRRGSGYMSGQGPDGTEGWKMDEGFKKELKTTVVRLTASRYLPGARAVQSFPNGSSLNYGHYQSDSAPGGAKKVAAGIVKPQSGRVLMKVAGPWPDRNNPILGPDKRPENIYKNFAIADIEGKTALSGWVRSEQAAFLNNQKYRRGPAAVSDRLVWPKAISAEVNANTTTTRSAVNQTVVRASSDAISGNGRTETACGKTATEVNIIVENVLKRLEKRMAIERDKRGRR